MPENHSRETGSVPKAVMRLPDLDEAKSTVPNSVSQRMVSELNRTARHAENGRHVDRAKYSDFPINISVAGTVFLV